MRGLDTYAISALDAGFFGILRSYWETAGQRAAGARLRHDAAAESTSPTEPRRAAWSWFRRRPTTLGRGRNRALTVLSQKVLVRPSRTTPRTTAGRGTARAPLLGCSGSVGEYLIPGCWSDRLHSSAEDRPGIRLSTHDLPLPGHCALRSARCHQPPSERFPPRLVV